MTTTTRTKIAELNDQFRRNLPSSNMNLSVGIYMKNNEEVTEIIELIKNFDTFTQDNDPYREHDFGDIKYKDQKIFWKIDYFDLNLEYLSPDSSDPIKTKRVLTIMLASEY